MGVNEQRYDEMRTITVVGAWVNLVLSALKIVLGVIGQSHALIADGVHSLSDLLSDALVLLAAKHSTKDADADHPYGHARIETVATVGLGIILLAVALGIAWDAARRLVSPDLLLEPGLLALLGAVLSIFAKELLYRYTLVVANRIKSNLLRANAWHHRSDAISSVVVVVGVAGAMAGFPYLDAIASIGVALMIAKIGAELAWQSLRELIDTALDADRVEAIRRTILGVDGVRDMHLLKTRRMGAEALVDVHVLLRNPRVSVSEGHQISETIRARLIREIEEVADVMVHIDPEDDETTVPNKALPLRAQAMERLGKLWSALPEAARIQDTRLHYLNGKLEVEVVLPLSILAATDNPNGLAGRLQDAAGVDPNVGRVRVYYATDA
jgi:cation diffusion facilitator family transporter